MGTADGETTEEGMRSIPWQRLRNIDQVDARLSRGFLRCRPEKWFPGFPAHWLPLFHSLGVEVRVMEVKPVRRAPKGLARGFYGVVDNERIAVYLDGDSERVVLSAVTPGANNQATSIVLEYLARRFFSSLATAWSGAETTVVEFMREVETHAFDEAGAVKFNILLNNSPCQIWILLGEKLVERFDGLWRRQIKSSHRFNDDELNIKVEILNKVVSQSEADRTVETGNLISLDENQLEYVTLLMGSKPWLPGKLCTVNGKFAIEVIAAPLSVANVSGGGIKLRAELGSIKLDSGVASELTQVGSILQSDIPLENRANIFLDDRKVAEGQVISRGNKTCIQIL